MVGKNIKEKLVAGVGSGTCVVGGIIGGIGSGRAELACGGSGGTFCKCGRVAKTGVYGGTG